MEIIPAPNSQAGSSGFTGEIKEPKISKLADQNEPSDLISFECIDTVDLDDNAEIISKGKTVTDGILGKEWLNSDHMSAVNKLMIEARYSVHGFQETTLAPVLKKDGT